MLSTYVKSPNSVDISSLRKKKEEKDKRYLMLYDNILQKCHKRIVNTAEKAQDSVFYTVPLFDINKPPITNVKACMAYVIYNLKKDGFDVTYIFPNMLWISWTEQRNDREQTVRTAARHESPKRAPGKAASSMEEKVMAVDKSIYRPMPKQKEHFSGGGIYDDVFPTLKEGAERMKRKKVI